MRFDPAATSRLTSGDAVVDGPVQAVARAEAESALRAVSAAQAGGGLAESVLVGKRGRKHALRFSADPMKRKALTMLPDLVSKAIYTLREPCNGGPDFTEVIKGRVAFSSGTEATQFQVVLFRRRSDGQLVYYGIVPYETRKRK